MPQISLSTTLRALLGVTLLVAGCGGEDDAGAGDSATAGPAAAAGAPDDAAPAGEGGELPRLLRGEAI